MYSYKTIQSRSDGGEGYGSALVPIVLLRRAALTPPLAYALKGLWARFAGGESDEMPKASI